MALDHALMARARVTGEAVLRVYTWSSPVLSLGRNQRAIGVYDDTELDSRGIVVVRRPTGGRALLHHREITYSVTAPSPSNDAVGAAYRRINDLLVTALASMGVAAGIAKPAMRAAAPGPQPCFALPAAGEIIVGNRKLVGSAQWREDDALLQHGSILVENDQSIISTLMRTSVIVPPAPVTLRDLLHRTPAAAELADALFAALRQTIDPAAAPLSEREAHALDLAPLVEHYHNPAWTWRR